MRIMVDTCASRKGAVGTSLGLEELAKCRTAESLKELQHRFQQRLLKGRVIGSKWAAHSSENC